jgi:5'-methylthioadenosine phosphorylase
LVFILGELKMIRVGIIGGSGVDDPDILENCKKIEADTPYGPPSSDIMTGLINDIQVLILARHGRKHQYSPTQVNNRANIYALKQAGATHILATTACGSLRQEIDRGHFVILDQFIDFTRFRKNTFTDSFEQGVVHTAMAHPFDESLRNVLYRSATELGLKVHGKGCVVTIEGPRFSTVAESNMFRLWGADVINMSTAPEAMLANEAGIPYAAVAMATDYDCWKQDEAPVTWDEILSVFNKNADNVKQLFIKTVSEITTMG